MIRPNVFLLLLDTLRADALASRAEGANLLSIAARGTRFLQCIATSPLTAPSFASILTGAYPPRHGIRGVEDHAPPRELPTLAELLLSAGYRTYAEISGPVEPEMMRGFEEVRRRRDDPEGQAWGSIASDRIGDLAPPWLLLLHVRGSKLQRPWNEPAQARTLAAVDKELAPIVAAAETNTLTIVTSTHGANPTGGLTRKLLRRAVVRRVSGLSEEEIRVPLILAGPGVGGYTVDDQVRHVDLLPTVADLCGIEGPGAPDGRSLGPYVEGGDLPQSPAYLETEHRKLRRTRIAAARTPDWKLLKPERGRPALYAVNGSGDANERRNVYSRYPEVARELESFIDNVVAGDARAPSYR